MDMKFRLFTTLSLLAVLVAACAPKASSPATQAAVPAQAIIVEPSATPGIVVEKTSQPAIAPTQDFAPTATTALPIATSRGPNLEATDPLTVSLASGNVHFVEFFRFT